MLLESEIGGRFDAILTGAASKGTWVRRLHPLVEGNSVLVCERLLFRFFHLLLPMLDKGVTHRDVRIDGRLLEGLIIPDLE